jgi:hypothetical protein
MLDNCIDMVMPDIDCEDAVMRKRNLLKLPTGDFVLEVDFGVGFSFVLNQHKIIPLRAQIHDKIISANFNLCQLAKTIRNVVKTSSILRAAINSK